MPKRDGAKNSHESMIAAGVIIVGVAIVVEMRYLTPHKPLAALFNVLGAALVASAIVLRIVRR